jgi:hypothetical protein
MTQVGKRYAGPGGAEFIVTKGGPGTLTDGDTALSLKDASTPAPAAGANPDAPQVQLGKRYKSADGAVELLVIKAGSCDLRYEGEAMELMQPKVLPSAD